MTVVQIESSRDRNGNARRFFIIATVKLGVRQDAPAMLARKEPPPSGAPITALIPVTPEVFRLLAVEHGITLNEEDAIQVASMIPPPSQTDARRLLAEEARWASGPRPGSRKVEP